MPVQTFLKYWGRRAVGEGDSILPRGEQELPLLPISKSPREVHFVCSWTELLWKCVLLVTHGGGEQRQAPRLSHPGHTQGWKGRSQVASTTQVHHSKVLKLSALEEEEAVSKILGADKASDQAVLAYQSTWYLPCCKQSGRQA